MALKNVFVANSRDGGVAGIKKGGLTFLYTIDAYDGDKLVAHIEKESDSWIGNIVGVVLAFLLGLPVNYGSVVWLSYVNIGHPSGSLTPFVTYTPSATSSNMIQASGYALLNIAFSPQNTPPNISNLSIVSLYISCTNGNTIGLQSIQSVSVNASLASPSTSVYLSSTLSFPSGVVLSSVALFVFAYFQVGVIIIGLVTPILYDVLPTAISGATTVNWTGILVAS